MRIESQQTRHPSLSLGGIQSALNHRLMADVDTIKDSQCKVQ